MKQSQLLGGKHNESNWGMKECKEKKKKSVFNTTFRVADRPLGKVGRSEEEIG